MVTKIGRKLKAMPITIKLANQFIRDHHRHHRPTVRNNGRWAIACINSEETLVGVAIASSPVSASYMDGSTLEVTRLCVSENAPKGACSFLLGRCCAVWRQMGGKRILTYTLQSESGASLRGAGWTLVGTVRPHKRWEAKSKSDGISRDLLPIYMVAKNRWEKTLEA